MGLNLFGRSSCATDTPTSKPTYSAPPALNPNPNKFRWTKEAQQTHSNGWTVVLIRYHDCTNYEGLKLLVYDNAGKFMTLEKLGSIDPHFDNQSYSPIARFVPTAKGWDLANKFAKGGI